MLAEYYPRLALIAERRESLPFSRQPDAAAQPDLHGNFSGCPLQVSLIRWLVESDSMKAAFAILGLGLLIVPLLRHVSFERRLNSAHSVGESVSTLMGISGGFTIAFVGVLILGILVDGGSGYRKPYVLILMAIIGGFWSAFYPSGWFLGVPLILYPLLHRFGFGSSVAKRMRQQDKRHMT